jgi:hypothetical protein
MTDRWRGIFNVLYCLIWSLGYIELYLDIGCALSDRSTVILLTFESQLVRSDLELIH